MNSPVLGILGGVGPLATAYFMQMLIRKTPARSDQEHMPMIVVNDPQIPDRTAYILDDSQPDPLPEMVRVAHELEDAGADYIAIPCNTAHYFYAALSESVRIPIVNIMEETAERIVGTIGSGGTVGLMATQGTVRSGVFQDYFAQRGLTTMVPTEEEQAQVTALIYDCVKANLPYDEQDLLRVATSLRERGCDAVVVGCTELSVIYQDMRKRPAWLFDSLDILANTCCAIYQAPSTSLLRLRSTRR